MNLLLRGLHHIQGTFELKVDLVAEGGVIGVFGSSGAGKTSLLEIIAGLRKPRTGLVELDRHVLLDCTANIFIAPECRGIGYVPQDLALFPHLSVRRNIEYGQRASATGEQRIGLDQVVHCLEIEDLLDRSSAQLSGGQRQRVAFARALLAQPRLLLLDEPLASLDHDLKLKIIPYLQRIRTDFEIPMLYVSHSPDEVAALCDQVLLLRAGECLGLRAPHEIFQSATALALKPGVL